MFKGIMASGVLCSLLLVGSVEAGEVYHVSGSCSDQTVAFLHKRWKASGLPSTMMECGPQGLSLTFYRHLTDAQRATLSHLLDELPAPPTTKKGRSS